MIENQSPIKLSYLIVVLVHGKVKKTCTTFSTMESKFVAYASAI